MNNMKRSLSLSLLGLLAFSLQAPAAVPEVKLSTWRENVPAERSKGGETGYCIRIDREEVPYGEFSALLSHLAVSGYYDVVLSYRGKLIEISSNDLENGLRVAVAIPSDEAASEPSPDPSSPLFIESRTEEGSCPILRWTIAAADAQGRAEDRERFRQLILASEKREMGFLFLVDPEVPVGALCDYITAIPAQVKIRGFLFGR